MGLLSHRHPSHRCPSRLRPVREPAVAGHIAHHRANANASALMSICSRATNRSTLLLVTFEPLPRVMWNLANAILSCPSLRAPVEHAFIRICERRPHQDVEVFTDASDGPADEVIARIADALALLANVEAGLGPRVQKLLPRLLVKERIRTQYWSASKTCVLERSFVLRSSDAYLACILVHESIHARLHRAGIRTPAHLRSRIEALCIESQIRFLEKLSRDEYPGTDRLIAYLRGLSVSDQVQE